MRLALFGGSFDPPHRGHIALALAAADALHLDRVLWAPVGLQALKGAAAAASYRDRLAMVQLASAADPRFHASELDAPRADCLPNYTVDTLRRLHTESPEADIFALVGMDALLDLPRWREAEQLPKLADWVAVTRPGFTLPPNAFPCQVLATVNVEVSATAVRNRLKSGLDCSRMVPEAVLEYIEERGLYGWPSR